MNKLLLSLFLVLALAGAVQANGHHGHYHGGGGPHYQNYSHYYHYPTYRPYYYPPVYVNPYPIYVNPYPQTYFNGPYIYQPNGMVFMWSNGILIRVR